MVIKCLVFSCCAQVCVRQRFMPSRRYEQAPPPPWLQPPSPSVCVAWPKRTTTLLALLGAAYWSTTVAPPSNEVVTTTGDAEVRLAELMVLEQRGRVALRSSDWHGAQVHFRAVMDRWQQLRLLQPKPHVLLSGCAASSSARLGYLAHERKAWSECVAHFGHTDGLGTVAGMQGLLLYERHILALSAAGSSQRRLLAEVVKLDSATLLATRGADWAACNKTTRRLVDQYATCLLQVAAQELSRGGRGGPSTEEAVALSAGQHARGSARRVL